MQRGPSDVSDLTAKIWPAKKTVGEASIPLLRHHCYLQPHRAQKNFTRRKVAGSQEGSVETRNSLLQGFLSSLFASIGGVFGTFSEADCPSFPRMDVRADVIHQQPRGAEKAKNVLGEARNRRVLQDIGNLVTDRTAQVKPAAQIAHPVRRSFGAQLVAKAQAAATENKKPTALVIDSKLAAEPEPVPKQVARKPDPEDVILISSSESEKGSASTRRALRKGSSRKKALTSVLTARSKAACGLADKLNNLVIDIDEGDADNELAVVEYIEDLYKFYKETEDEGRVHDYMDLQPE
ncbi:hypothetical protein CRG98_021869, partial [Punica granatum]